MNNYINLPDEEKEQILSQRALPQINLLQGEEVKPLEDLTNKVELYIQANDRVKSAAIALQEAEEAHTYCETSLEESIPAGKWVYGKGKFYGLSHSELVELEADVPDFKIGTVIQDWTGQLDKEKVKELDK